MMRLEGHATRPQLFTRPSSYQLNASIGVAMLITDNDQMQVQASPVALDLHWENSYHKSNLRSNVLNSQGRVWMDLALTVAFTVSYTCHYTSVEVD